MELELNITNNFNNSNYILLEKTSQVNKYFKLEIILKLTIISVRAERTYFYLYNNSKCTSISHIVMVVGQYTSLTSVTRELKLKNKLNGFSNLKNLSK